MPRYNAAQTPGGAYSCQRMPAGNEKASSMSSSEMLLTQNSDLAHATASAFFQLDRLPFADHPCHLQHFRRYRRHASLLDFYTCRGVLVSETDTTCVIPATCTSTLAPAAAAPSGIILPLPALVRTGVLAVGMSGFTGIILASGRVQTGSTARPGAGSLA